jgi:hypothetical protein
VKSAGLLLFRQRHEGIEVLLVHPGGPYWKNKDRGAWSIPKGELMSRSTSAGGLVMKIRFALATAVAVLLMLSPGIASRIRAAQATPQPQAGMADMMKMHEQMMAEMKAAEARLDALVKDMNTASGDAKVTAMAAVVNEMVRQQKAMHGHMDHMHQQMMGRGMMGR